MYLLFSLLFLFDVSKIKTLSSLKILPKKNFILVTVILIFLSMSGIPPLIGFVGKFLLFNFLLFSQKYVYIIAFSLLNFFSTYFYIQNLRFLVSSAESNLFLINGFYAFFNKSLVNVLVLLNLFNLFGILYFGDVICFFLNTFLSSCFF